MHRPSGWKLVRGVKWSHRYQTMKLLTPEAIKTFTTSASASTFQNVHQLTACKITHFKYLKKRWHGTALILNPSALHSLQHSEELMVHLEERKIPSRITSPCSTTDPCLISDHIFHVLEFSLSTLGISAKEPVSFPAITVAVEVFLVAARSLFF